MTIHSWKYDQLRALWTCWCGEVRLVEHLSERRFTKLAGAREGA